MKPSGLSVLSATTWTVALLASWTASAGPAVCLELSGHYFFYPDRDEREIVIVQKGCEAIELRTYMIDSTGLKSEVELQEFVLDGELHADLETPAIVTRSYFDSQGWLVREFYEAYLDGRKRLMQMVRWTLNEQNRLLMRSGYLNDRGEFVALDEHVGRRW